MSQSTNKEEKKITAAEAKKALWHRGELRYKLYPVQQEIYDFIQTGKNKISVVLSTRRLGKSFILCLMAVEQCVKQSGSVVKFIAAKQKDIRLITRLTMREVLKDCPTELRPEYKVNEHLYRFPNGSEIQLAGTDKGHSDSIRGGYAHLCIVDEAGFCDDLEYTINSVLMPTTATTKGKIILLSSPPDSPDHDFVKFIERAKLRNAFIKKTVYENPLIPKDELETIIDTYEGGVNSIAFRREYLAEIIKDENFAIVPEFTEELESQIVKEVDRPPYFDTYVAMDIGFKDMTVALFAYYDFRQNKLIIEDELALRGHKMTTDFLAEKIREKEKSLWGERKVYQRICDNNLIVINDLQRLHNLTFLPTAKDNADAALNNMRIKLTNAQIIINPRCKTLISHLSHGIWNKNKTSFARSADSGHYDAIDALKYLVRNVHWHKNPYPSNYGLNGGDDLFISEFNENNSLYESMKNIFSVKKRR